MYTHNVEGKPMLVISYVPLFTNKPYDIKLTEDAIDDFVDNLESKLKLGSATACLWLRDDSPHPVFIMEHGDDIADHLTLWSEGKPSDWFNLMAVECDDGHYTLMIIPRVDKSIKRHGANMNKAILNSDCKVVFVPLQCRAEATDSSRVFLKELSGTVRIGILDESYTLFGDIKKLNFEKVVNWFDIVLTESDKSEHMDTIKPLLFGGNIIRDYGVVPDVY
jgi:hypothetical protein